MGNRIFYKYSLNTMTPLHSPQPQTATPSNRVADMTGASAMPFGRHKGKRLDTIPAVYLLWLFDRGCTHSGVKRYILNNKVALDREAANIRRK